MKQFLVLCAVILFYHVAVSQITTKRDSLVDQKMIKAGHAINDASRQTLFGIGLTAWGGGLMTLGAFSNDGSDYILYAAGGAFIAAGVINYVGSIFSMRKAGRILMTPTGLIIKF